MYELTAEEIRENLKEVRANVAAACARGGRGAGEVTLCAVSKLKPASDIRAAMEAGQLLFGENYVQELRDKYAELGDACQWHMIGHLQRNKVKYLTGKVSMIESVDSTELARQIEKEAAKYESSAAPAEGPADPKARSSYVMDILLEVNIAGEESKWGFRPEETIAAAREIDAMEHIRIRGLMTSAPYTEDPETNRIHFRALKALFDELAAAGLSGAQIDTLSMGMTGDYVVAVEEGATLIRVGTGIFGRRDYSK